MITAFIAVDECTRENGCLQVVLGSQRCGRIDHVMHAGQTMADLKQVEWICENFAHIHVEMEPGFFLFCFSMNSAQDPMVFNS